ncbi:hypothetical protein SV7mr_15120 [Stieleria bergensis]|uniref:Uncharacterized protein n=1 Tax=Stieleria bergensis TaxID=2528025 RepID=A0A517SSA1_9BACT|nr:hypothetical protein SV7mr_15120 [Planctomycetes bacterium SV_7m_r]
MTMVAKHASLAAHCHLTHCQIHRFDHPMLVNTSVELTLGN